MKAKPIFITLAAAVIALGSFKVSQLVRHARHDLVTLNVSGAPLADVLARVARQTRETIVADQALGGTITLNVRQAPLRQVLGQIADQAGGFSRLNFAVGSSATALNQLQSSLRQGQPPDQSGWTNLSAAIADEEPPMESRGVGRAGGNAVRVETPDASGRPQPGGPDNTRITLLATGPDGVARTMDLSPERVLMETGLAATLSLSGPVRPSAERAAELALQLGGKWLPLYTLEAVPLPPGGLPPDLNQFGWASADQERGPGGPPEPGDMEATVRRHRFNQLTRLTPEQRARAAAQQPGPGMNFEVDVEAR